MTMQQAILEKKEALAASIGEPLSQLATQCETTWSQAHKLDQLLLQEIGAIPNCEYLYAWNLEGRMVSSLVRTGAIDPSWRGWDLSNRPYLKNNLPFKGIMLSSVYRSMYPGQEFLEKNPGFRLGELASDKLARA